MMMMMMMNGGDADQGTLGTTPFLTTASILLEREDAGRLTLGEEVTLMAWGNAIIRNIIQANILKPLLMYDDV